MMYHSQYQSTFLADTFSSQEKFLGFYLCTSGVTGEAIATNIMQLLTFWQLEFQIL